MATIKIPADTSSIKEKIKLALQKKSAPLPPVKDPAAKARADKEAAARVRAKELAKELDATKQTAEEKDATIKELQEQLAIISKERDELKPLADEHKKFTHVEKARLIEKLPPEQRKEAKELPLNALRTFVKAFTGGSAPAAAGAPVVKDEATLLKLAETDPEAFLKALEPEKK